MNLSQSVVTVFGKYASFAGRAGRSEFWWWVLFTTLTGWVLGMLSGWAVQLSGGVFPGDAVSIVWALAVLLPSLAVQVRRLRDAGFGWGHVFWVLVPVAGVIVLAALSAQPSSERVRRPGDPAIAGVPV